MLTARDDPSAYCLHWRVITLQDLLPSSSQGGQHRVLRGSRCNKGLVLARAFAFALFFRGGISLIGGLRSCLEWEDDAVVDGFLAGF